MIDEIKKQMSAEEQTELDKTKLVIKEGDDLVEKGEKILTEAEEDENSADNLSIADLSAVLTFFLAIAFAVICAIS